jgi:hypothetical protein
MQATETILTAADVRNLRKSDRWVSLHARWIDGECVESHIVGKSTDVAGEDYTTADVHVPSTFSYGGGIVRANADVRAYIGVMCPRFQEHWATFLSYVRAGDRVVLLWNANGHRNELTRNAGLCVDGLDIRVERGNRRMTFHIESRVSTYNSARAFSIADTFNPVTSDRDTDAMA